jgi:hypothetical protein
VAAVLGRPDHGHHRQQVTVPRPGTKQDPHRHISSEHEPHCEVNSLPGRDAQPQGSPTPRSQPIGPGRAALATGKCWRQSSFSGVPSPGSSGASGRQPGSPHPCGIHRSAPPARMRRSTALDRRSLIRMRSQVQVLAGPPTNPAGHGHPSGSSALALPAVLPGSCHPRATTTGNRVLRTRRCCLDQLVQSSGDGGVPPGQDVLVAQGGGRGGVSHPHHQLAGAGAGSDRQGGGGVAKIVEAEPLDPGVSGGRDPDPAGE